MQADRAAVSEAATVAEHEFYFTRGIYTSDAGDYLSTDRWAIDYPKADRQFLTAVTRLTGIDAYELDHAIALDDPRLRQYPFLYMLEVGSIALPEAEGKALQDYLLAGGFLLIDDFWGSWAWERFEAQMQALFPTRPIVEIPPDHPVFSIFYRIDDIVQVPNLYQGAGAASGGPTHEYDGYEPRVRGIFDDEGRLMVLINWNTDLGDAWEWADHPSYPLRFSTFAYEMGINAIVYAMTY